MDYTLGLYKASSESQKATLFIIVQCFVHIRTEFIPLLRR